MNQYASPALPLSVWMHKACWRSYVECTWGFTRALVAVRSEVVRQVSLLAAWLSRSTRSSCELVPADTNYTSTMVDHASRIIASHARKGTRPHEHVHVHVKSGFRATRTCTMYTAHTKLQKTHQMCSGLGLNISGPRVTSIGSSPTQKERTIHQLCWAVAPDKNRRRKIQHERCRIRASRLRAYGKVAALAPWLRHGDVRILCEVYRPQRDTRRILTGPPPTVWIAAGRVAIVTSAGVMERNRNPCTQWGRRCCRSRRRPSSKRHMQCGHRRTKEYCKSGRQN